MTHLIHTQYSHSKRMRRRARRPRQIIFVELDEPVLEMAPSHQPHLQLVVSNPHIRPSIERKREALLKLA